MVSLIVIAETKKYIYLHTDVNMLVVLQELVNNFVDLPPSDYMITTIK